MEMDETVLINEFKGTGSTWQESTTSAPHHKGSKLPKWLELDQFPKETTSNPLGPE